MRTIPYSHNFDKVVNKVTMEWLSTHRAKQGDSVWDVDHEFHSFIEREHGFEIIHWQDINIIDERKFLLFILKYG